jgi:hypothetical protein
VSGTARKKVTRRERIAVYYAALLAAERNRVAWLVLGMALAPFVAAYLWLLGMVALGGSSETPRG